MNQMFGAHMLTMKPQDAIIVPAIVTIRHPNLFVSALAIGPEETFTEIPCIIITTAADKLNPALTDFGPQPYSRMYL